jgi:spore maturation protein A
MIDIIWFGLITIGAVYSILTGNVSNINKELFQSSKSAFNLILELLPILVMWMGILNIAEKGGLLKKISYVMRPVLHKLFPRLNKDDKALEYISSNIAANMIGLGSAATPFGLKAMQELQKNNPKKDTATKEMITFLVLNTSGVTIIPTTVIGLRIASKSINPEAIIITSLLATICSTVFGLLLDYLIRRKHD